MNKVLFNYFRLVVAILDSRIMPTLHIIQNSPVAFIDGCIAVGVSLLRYCVICLLPVIAAIFDLRLTRPLHRTVFTPANKILGMQPLDIYIYIYINIYTGMSATRSHVSDCKVKTNS